MTATRRLTAIHAASSLRNAERRELFLSVYRLAVGEPA